MTTVLFPGQGTQYKGMGGQLFKDFPQMTWAADDILGYSIEELCVADPGGRLGQTQYTQPAIYVVNAMTYYNMYTSAGRADYFMGHSLGEYNALLAAEAFSFDTGLRLVKKRGELMGRASGGGMLAVLGLDAEEVKALLADQNVNGIDLANYNTPTQITLSGKRADIQKIEEIFRQKDIRCIPLQVSAAFHSRYMQRAEDEFGAYLDTFAFSDLKSTVISNVTGRPYSQGEQAILLRKQISNSVLWVDSVQYLLDQGEQSFDEIGSSILTKMVNEIRNAACYPLNDSQKDKLPQGDTVMVENASRNQNCVTYSPMGQMFEDQPAKPGLCSPGGKEEKDQGISAFRLGSRAFREDYKVKYAYVAGGMYRGIASKEMVVRLGRAGMIGFFGTGGLTLNEIKNNVQYIQRELPAGEPYGMNFLYKPYDDGKELISFYMEAGIEYLEVAAFMQITEALVWYRLKGLTRDAPGRISDRHKILAKVSRPEVAEMFMSPAPDHLVKQLLDLGRITEEQAEWGKGIPMSYDICIEADSGGHTDGGIPTVLMPSMQRLRQDLTEKYRYQKPIRLGLAGGIGTPDAAAAAFIMGADFILTGSINQCTVEAKTSDAVKNMLQDINVQDTDYAPAGDMFELGAKVQVMKKGVFFSARANKLYQLYKMYNSLDEIPEKIRRQIEDLYFQKSFDQIWQETKTYFQSICQEMEIDKAEANPKHKMALTFRWYFNYSSVLAFKGDRSQKINFQVHTGPALGAFNQWVKGTSLAKWTNRHVDEIGVKLMQETANLLNQRMKSLFQG